MKSKAILGAQYRPEVVATFAEHFAVVPCPGLFLTADTVPQDARDARAMITRGGVSTPAALMDALPALGLIVCYGTGYEGVDLVAAAQREIAVAYSPGGNASSVADMATGLMLAATRTIAFADRFVRAGKWKTHPPAGIPVVPGLTRRRAGIFGLGLIGAKIAARCAALEMEVAYHGREARPGVAYTYFASLLDMARWADVLIVATRLTPETRHAVDRDVLGALGPSGYVVNIARGAIIDQPALVQALSSGTIAGAGLDVFEGEPGVPEALARLDNVVMTPHLGGSSDSAQEASQAMVIANVKAFFEGRPLPTPVPQQETIRGSGGAA